MKCSLLESHDHGSVGDGAVASGGGSEVLRDACRQRWGAQPRQLLLRCRRRIRDCAAVRAVSAAWRYLAARHQLARSPLRSTARADRTSAHRLLNSTGASSCTLRIRNTRCVMPEIILSSVAAIVVAGAGQRAFEPFEHAHLVALGLQAADEPGARVRKPLVVEIHGILRGEHAAERRTRAPA